MHSGMVEATVTHVCSGGKSVAQALCFFSVYAIKYLRMILINWRHSPVCMHTFLISLPDLVLKKQIKS